METKPLTPEDRARRRFLVGSPVRMLDGNEWKVPALPVGAAGDLIAATMEKLSEIETDLQIVGARQDNELRAALLTVEDDEGEEKARLRYRAHQVRIHDLERQAREAQLALVYHALSLLYDVTEEEVGQLADLRACRQVHGIVAGAPQLDELREVMEAVKGGGASGNSRSATRAST